MMGIYGYWDNEKNYVAYIGQTKDLERRKREHLYKSSTKKFDRVLQNNLERYEYFILAEGEFTDKELNEMEEQAISIFKTNKYKNPDKSVFNFTDGGEGTKGCDRTGEKNSFYGHHHTEEWKQKYRYGKNNPMYGKEPPHKRKDIPSEKELLAEYENGGITQRQMAEKYNCHLSMIEKRLRKARGEVKND